MSPLVILVSGKLQSGKNTFADILKELIEDQLKQPVAIDYFAKLLKDMCKEAFRPLTDYLNEMIGNCDDQYGANGCYLKDQITKDENWYESKNEITRRILQAVGTEIVRKVNETFWTDSFIERANYRDELITICSDVRFRNEISEVSDCFKVIKIRVNRDMDRESSINEHASEKALDDYKDWDYVIDNNGTLDDLRLKAQKIVDELKL